MFLHTDGLGMEDVSTTGRGTAKRRSNLADLEERLELFVENVRDYAIFMLDPQGRVITWNAGVQRVLGYREEEFIGLDFRRLFRTAEQGAAQEEMSQAAETGRSEDERWHVRKDATELWVSGVLTALRDARGGIRGFAKIMRDTTALKILHTEREDRLRQEREMRDQAERANRIKDEFLGTVSHELRTPLNAILGWARMLSSGQVDSTRSARAIHIIERNADWLARLVEDLIDVSRIMSGKLELDVRRVEMGEVVDTALESLQNKVEEKKIQVKVSRAADLTPIEGDPVRLRQVISNLLSNAVKFTPSGGTVTVDVHRRDGEIHVTVEDTGIGISTAALPHIFDRFHQAATARRRTDGLGLGLAIARQIVAAHHGTIEAHSEGEGKGARFIVRLPLVTGLSFSDEESFRPGFAPETECSPQLAGLCALVVEDQHDARELVQLILQRCGMRVLAVDSIGAALAAIGQHAIDVIVSDIGLARSDDGLALIRAVRERGSANGGPVPAVAVTAYGSAEDRKRVLAAGYQAHVTKPLEPSELIAAVATVVSG